MDPALVDRIQADMRFEFARTAPPDGFPAFHDIATERHTSDEFHDLGHIARRVRRTQTAFCSLVLYFHFDCHTKIYPTDHR